MLRGYRADSYAERALALLEKDVCYLARTNWGYGMPVADVEQELRIQIWKKLHLYHPGKKALRTWAQQVMRNRLIDMSRKKKELLDSDKRFYIDGTDAGEKFISSISVGFSTAHTDHDFEYYESYSEYGVGIEW